jgi:hypothetical protein
MYSGRKSLIFFRRRLGIERAVGGGFEKKTGAGSIFLARFYDFSLV